MKYLTYFVTFFARPSIYMMRTAIPFVQLQLMHFFAINKVQMGLANALLYIFIGISYFIRSIFPFNDIQFTYFVSTNLCNLSLLIIPLLISFNTSITPLYYVSLAGFGFFQTASWPVLLQLIHIYFQPKNDGCVLGLWSANGDFGYVFGFGICTLIVYALNLPYQFCLYAVIFYSIILSFTVYKLPIQHAETIDSLQPEDIQKADVFHQHKKVIRQPEVVFVVVLMCFLKALLYGIMLWLPMYFEKLKFQQYKGYIPMIMNTMAIFGSIVLGTIYQRVTNKILRNIIFMISLLTTCACFFVIKQVQFTYQNRFILQILIGILGFCIQGNYNILSTHEITSICMKLGLRITSLSSFSSTFTNISTGIIQLILGGFATDSANSIFQIFFIMSIIIIAFQIFRIIVLWHISSKRNQQDEEVKQSVPLMLDNIENQNNEKNTIN